MGTDSGAGPDEGADPDPATARSPTAVAATAVALRRTYRRSVTVGFGYVAASVAALVLTGLLALGALVWAAWGLAAVGLAGVLPAVLGWRAVARGRFLRTVGTPEENAGRSAHRSWNGMVACVVLGVLSAALTVTFAYQATLPLVRVSAVVEDCEVHGHSKTCVGRWSFAGTEHHGIIAGSSNAEPGDVVTTGVRPDSPDHTVEPHPAGAAVVFGFISVLLFVGALLLWRRWHRRSQGVRDWLARRIDTAITTGVTVP